MVAPPEPAAVPAPTPKPATDRKSMMLSWGTTLIFDIGVVLLTYNLAKSAGWTDQIAYLISAVGPLISMAISWIRAKTLTGFSLIILVFLVTSSVATLVGSADPRLLIVKDSVSTGLFGMVILVSRLFPKPLMFYMGPKFATDGSKAGLAWWYSLWQFPDFRASQYRISYAWACDIPDRGGCEDRDCVLCVELPSCQQRDHVPPADRFRSRACLHHAGVCSYPPCRHRTDGRSEHRGGSSRA